jgi:hypothetical protein
VNTMRYVAACLIGSALAAGAAFAKPKPGPASLTVLFRFDGPYSERSVLEMKRELGLILKDSGIEIDWRNRDEVTAYESFPNFVVAKFRGKCRMEPAPFLYDERGPLGFTYSSDGSVLSFSEIECDKVRSSLRTAMWGGDYGHSDELFGRALARVLAHELYHMLTGTQSHAETGVARRSLSGSELISDRLRLTQAELDRIRSAVVGPPPVIDPVDKGFLLTPDDSGVTLGRLVSKDRQ